MIQAENDIEVLSNKKLITWQNEAVKYTDGYIHRHTLYHSMYGAIFNQCSVHRVCVFFTAFQCIVMSTHNKLLSCQLLAKKIYESLRFKVTRNFGTKWSETKTNEFFKSRNYVWFLNLSDSCVHLHHMCYLPKKKRNCIVSFLDFFSSRLEWTVWFVIHENCEILKKFIIQHTACTKLISVFIDRPKRKIRLFVGNHEIQQ